MPLERRWELYISQVSKFLLLQVLIVLLSHELTDVLANIFVSCLEALNL